MVTVTISATARSGIHDLKKHEEVCVWLQTQLYRLVDEVNKKGLKYKYRYNFQSVKPYWYINIILPESEAEVNE